MPILLQYSNYIAIKSVYYIAIKMAFFVHELEKLVCFCPIAWAIGNSGNGNWKRKNGSGKWKLSKLIQMNARVKPMINDNLLKTTSVQRPPLCKDHIIIMSQRWQMTEAYLLKGPYLCKDHLSTDFIYLCLNPHLWELAVIAWRKFCFMLQVKY